MKASQVRGAERLTGATRAERQPGIWIGRQRSGPTSDNHLSLPSPRDAMRQSARPPCVWLAPGPWPVHDTTKRRTCATAARASSRAITRTPVAASTTPQGAH